MVLFLLSVANKALSLVRKNSEETSKKTSVALVHEYALVMKYFFDGAQNDLKQFSNSVLLKNAKTENEIRSWMKERNDNKADYFDKLGFAFLNGKCLTIDSEYDVSEQKFFSTIINHNIDNAIVGPFKIEDGSYIIVVAQTVTNFDGSIKGIISGTIKLSKLRKITDSLNIDTSSRFFLIGDEGKFVCHTEDKYLGNIFIPPDPKYAQYTSAYFNVVRHGIFNSLNFLGEPVKIYLEPVERLNWTCGIVVPEKDVMTAHAVLRDVILHELSVAILIVFVLFIFSYLILNNTRLWDSYYDSLTELWTRSKFEKEAQNLLESNPQSRFVVMEIDFPGFKFINQGYGSEVANGLLKTTATEILSFSQYRGGLCGRGYADRFFILDKIDNVAEFMEDFEKMTNNLDDILSVKGSPVHLKYGITFVLPDLQFYSRKRYIQDLIGEAAYAKSQIKNNMLQRYSIYSIQMQQKVEREQLIERQMERALASGEFFVMYQPKIGLSDDKIKGAEALVRWNSSNEKLGFLSPGEFIPVFERNGFIVKLDFAVYEMVFKFLRTQIDLKNPVVPISVNMSRNHSNPEKFVAEFVARFNKYNLPPELIEIEIIERSADEDNDNLVRVTDRLHEYGFTVAMDDFGSGQSSLNMLSEVPIDVLKFDQNFLRREHSKSGHFNMINTLIELGKQLNKKTLFEGVETEEQRDMLRKLHCDQVQGYFYSKPLNEKDFIQFVKDNI